MEVMEVYIEDMEQAGATSIIVSYTVGRYSLPIIQARQSGQHHLHISPRMVQIKNILILILLAVCAFSCSLLINFFILLGEEGGSRTVDLDI